MRTYKLTRQTLVHADMDDVWEYFSNPQNLNDLTPADVHFEMLDNDLPEKMYAGMLINYKICPLLGISFRWVTEITHCEFHQSFTDVQKKGPYALWHHRHTFEQTQSGVLMTDEVDYALPMGFIGQLSHTLFIRKKLQNIFEYRAHTIEKKFPR